MVIDISIVMAAAFNTVPTTAPMVAIGAAHLVSALSWSIEVPLAVLRWAAKAWVAHESFLICVSGSSRGRQTPSSPREVLTKPNSTGSAGLVGM